MLKLSGGQQQRVAIARALTSDAKVILADGWKGLADLLANLIAKYAFELSIDDMPNTSHNKEHNSDSKTLQNRTFVVSENGMADLHPMDTSL